MECSGSNVLSQMAAEKVFALPPQSCSDWSGRTDGCTQFRSGPVRTNRHSSVKCVVFQMNPSHESLYNVNFWHESKCVGLRSSSQSWVCSWDCMRAAQLASLLHESTRVGEATFLSKVSNHPRQAALLATLYLQFLQMLH